MGFAHPAQASLMRRQVGQSNAKPNNQDNKPNRLLGFISFSANLLKLFSTGDTEVTEFVGWAEQSEAQQTG